jgi:hypothetical protein
MMMSESGSENVAPVPTSRPVLRFTMRALLLATAGLALVSAFAAWMFRYERSRALAEAVVGRMKTAQLALMNYESARGALPPAVHLDSSGQPLSSWRFRVAPFAGYNQLGASDEYNVAWNAPINRRNQSSWAAGFYCGQSRPGNQMTDVFAVTGHGTAFDPPLTFHWDELPRHYIVLIEIADSKTHWMQPGDYDVTKLLAAKGRVGDHLHGVLPDRSYVLFADGELWGISTDAPLSALQPFLTIAGADSHDRSQLLEPYLVR